MFVCPLVTASMGHTESPVYFVMGLPWRVYVPPIKLDIKQDAKQYSSGPKCRS